MDHDKDQLSDEDKKQQGIQSSRTLRAAEQGSDGVTDVLSRARIWIAKHDAAVQGGGGFGRDTEKLYGSTRQLIADLLARAESDTSKETALRGISSYCGEYLEPERVAAMPKPEDIAGHCKLIADRALISQSTQATASSASEVQEEVTNNE